MINEYVIWFVNHDHHIVISIEQKDRPNNPEDDELISEYILNNYGYVDYKIVDLDTLEKIVIK